MTGRGVGDSPRGSRYPNMMELGSKNDFRYAIAPYTYSFGCLDTLSYFNHLFCARGLWYTLAHSRFADPKSGHGSSDTAELQAT